MMPIALARCGVTVTAGWVDCSISSRSYSEIRDAWIAAPRADREDGSTAVGRVEGEMMRVSGGKRD